MKSPPILGLLISLLTDVKRLEPDVKGLDRDILTIKARFKHEGNGFLSVALAALCDSVDYGLAYGGFACPSHFSRCGEGALPKLFSGLLCKVFDEKSGNLKECPPIGVIKCLREALKLFKKLRLGEARDKTLHLKAVRAFWDAECRISESKFDSIRSDLLSRVGGFVLSSLGSYEPDKIRPRHGPGAVYEGVASNQKWLLACQGILDESFDICTFGFDSFLASDRGEEVSKVQISADGLSINTEPGLSEVTGSPDKPSCSGLARLVSVPKNSISRRTITVEPALNMFIQQGLNTDLRVAITRCSVLKRSLALTDQSFNQELALIGSRTGEWATLDLSSASDLMSLSLVHKAFEKHEAFYRLMVNCRSSHVHNELTNSDERLAKFAGMGNALTFPVQSITFALLAICAILYCQGRSRPSLWDVRRTARQVRVYGDDIIVPSNYAHQVADWIESFGLKVNRKKSFLEGNFRESCGLDAFRGYDVTPLYIKDDPAFVKDPSALAGFVAASNQAWLMGLYGLSNELRGIVEDTLRSNLPLLSRSSGALGWHSRVDASDVQRWNTDLQRLEVRAPVLVSQMKKDRIDGNALLLKFFLTPLIERCKGHSNRSVRRFFSRIAWRWVPAQAGNIQVSRLDAIKR